MRKILHPKKGSVPLNFNENSIFQEKSADKNKNFHVMELIITRVKICVNKERVYESELDSEILLFWALHLAT